MIVPMERTRLVKSSLGGGQFLGRPPEEILYQIHESKAGLERLTVSDIVNTLNEFSLKLFKDDSQLMRRFPNHGLPFLVRFCSRESLEDILSASFENPLALDKFIEKGRANRQECCVPRGVVGHWAAGNVPTLGFLTAILATLTKNVNLVRLSTSAGLFVPSLLQTLWSLGEAGKLIASSIILVTYDWSEENEIGEFMSELSDVRVIWGSDESVSEIKRLPAKVRVVDLVFSNKTSFAIVGRSALAKRKMQSLARLVAHDISVFNQQACASPHTVFLRTLDKEVLRNFCEELANALHSVGRDNTSQPVSSDGVMAVLNLRTQYHMMNTCWSSDDMSYSIFLDDKAEIGPAIGNRSIFIRPLPDLEVLKTKITSSIQTVGVMASSEEFEEITRSLAKTGVERFTPLGAMTDFESPWDGFLMPQMFVRSISRARPNLL